jgi:hypothetical protein
MLVVVSTPPQYPFLYTIFILNGILLFMLPEMDVKPIKPLGYAVIGQAFGPNPGLSRYWDPQHEKDCIAQTVYVADPR